MRESIETKLAALHLTRPDDTLREKIVTRTVKETQKRRYATIAVQAALSFLIITLIWAHFKEKDTMNRIAAIQNQKEMVYTQRCPGEMDSFLGKISFLVKFSREYWEQRQISHVLSNEMDKTHESSS